MTGIPDFHREDSQSGKHWFWFNKKKGEKNLQFCTEKVVIENICSMQVWIMYRKWHHILKKNAVDMTEVGYIRKTESAFVFVDTVKVYYM